MSDTRVVMPLNLTCTIYFGHVPCRRHVSFLAHLRMRACCDLSMRSVRWRQWLRGKVVFLRLVLWIQLCETDRQRRGRQADILVVCSTDVSCRIPSRLALSPTAPCRRFVALWQHLHVNAPLQIGPPSIYFQALNTHFVFKRNFIEINWGWKTTCVFYSWKFDRRWAGQPLRMRRCQ